MALTSNYMWIISLLLTVIIQVSVYIVCDDAPNIRHHLVIRTPVCHFPFLFWLLSLCAIFLRFPVDTNFFGKLSVPYHSNRAALHCVDTVGKSSSLWENKEF